MYTTGTRTRTSGVGNVSCGCHKRRWLRRYGTQTRAVSTSEEPVLQNRNDEAFRTLQMEMGFCRINQPYSPEMLKESVFSSPESIFSTTMRSVYMFSNIFGF